MDVEQILQDNDIEYEDHGKRLMALCPFHEDTVPSCGIWADTGYFKCFACQEEGSLADFLAKALDISNYSAWRLTRQDDSVLDMENRIRKHLHEDEDTFKYFNVKSFHKIYPKVVEGSPAWEYVMGRGISPQMIREFDMRVGVRKYHDRVVIPIYTPEGKLVSYVGRAIPKGMLPKTKKSRSPHRTLFGMRQAVRKWPGIRLCTVVVEGEFDAIYLQQFGIAAVANMGTMEMTPDKVLQLRRYSKRVVLSYDGDEAGQRAMYGDEKRVGALTTLSRHVPTITVQLPEEADPNSMTPEQVEEYYGEFKVEEC